MKKVVPTKDVLIEKDLKTDLKSVSEKIMAEFIFSQKKFRFEVRSVL